MIIYVTKLTFDRYRCLIPPEDLTSPISNLVADLMEKEEGDRLLEWGAKLFYFDGKKCIQVVNFASKFTLFLFDMKSEDLVIMSNMMAHYMRELYKEDKEMLMALNKMFDESPNSCFVRLTDKSAIATLNRAQRDFAFDGYRFYTFIQDGILNTVEINREVNFDWMVTMKEQGKTNYIFGGEKFRELVLKRYRE